MATKQAVTKKKNKSRAIKKPVKKVMRKKTRAKKSARPALTRKKLAKKKAKPKTTTKRKISKKKGATKAATKKKAAKKKAQSKTTAKRKTSKKKGVTKAATKKKAAKKKAQSKTTAKRKTSKKKVISKGALIKKPKAGKRSVIKKSIANKKTVSGDFTPRKKPVKPARGANKTKQNLLTGPARGIDPYKPKRGEAYMSDAQLEHFRKLLDTWKAELMEEVDRTMSYMKDDAANFPDPNDRATQESEFGIELRTRDRERKLLKKIGLALQRIEEHNYGYCEVTGEEIGLRRLEARPVATLCVEAQEQRERSEKQFRDREDYYR